MTQITMKIRKMVFAVFFSMMHALYEATPPGSDTARKRGGFAERYLKYIRLSGCYRLQNHNGVRGLKSRIQSTETAE